MIICVLRDGENGQIAINVLQFKKKKLLLKTVVIFHLIFLLLKLNEIMSLKT